MISKITAYITYIIVYNNKPQLLQKINLKIFGCDQIAFTGFSSGKSLLVKAIMNNEEVYHNGEWLVPKICDIAYLDQHYSNLPLTQTVIEYIKSLKSAFSYSEFCNFLNQFLFSKN